MVNNKKTAIPQIERTLAIAGVGLVILGCISSIFYGFTNRGFMGESILDFILYFNYVVLLGGGFVVGYLLAKTPQTRIFVGATYALLAMSIYLLIDLARITIIRSMFGTLPFPWERIIFEGGPLFALVITAIIATLLQHGQSRTNVSMGAKWMLIITFIGTQLYYLLDEIYVSIQSTSDHSYISPIWLVIGGYLINPLLISLLTYVSINIQKSPAQRLFYSVFLGSTSSIFFLALGNFSTSPSLSATNVFETIAIITTLLATLILIWRARLATTR